MPVETDEPTATRRRRPRLPRRPKPTDVPTRSTTPRRRPTHEAEADESARRRAASRQTAPSAASSWSRVVAFGVLPALALVLALGAGIPEVAGQLGRGDRRRRPAAESVQAAKDSTVALLSYKPDTVEQQLGAARDLLTGDFRDSYTR